MPSFKFPANLVVLLHKGRGHEIVDPRRRTRLVHVERQFAHFGGLEPADLSDNSIKKNWLEFWLKNSLRFHFDPVTYLKYPILNFLLV